MSENKIGDLNGIVLCGGRSKRMGKEKGLCLLKEKPMITYAIDLCNRFCNSIIIGANNPDYISFGYPVINDEIAGIGPLGGIYTCLKSSPSDDNFILSCDIPLVSLELVQFILSKREKYEVVIPVFNGFLEPLCAYYNRSIVLGLENAIEKKSYKIQDVLKSLNTRYLEIDSSLEFYHEHLFANINSQNELNEIEKHL
ncbi:MAG: molybdenum cofactor guanylyltransferase [Bacteroidales bacterium]